jgi:catechol 2,3-dioxygenase-like lactoylglutathione lyase family enzyme
MKASYETQQTSKVAKVGCHFAHSKTLQIFRSILLALTLLMGFTILQGHGAADLARAGTLVQAVGAIEITVADMERSVAFYEQVLRFKKLSDVEVHGTEYEHLQGVFGLRMRVVHLQLGREMVVLTEYLAPQGRPIPVDSRSNDGWFQHIAIIVSDMDQAYQHLRQHKVRHASTGPQTIPAWNRANDIWHWQIHAITTNPDEAFNVLRSGKTTFVSTGSVVLPNKSLGFNKGLLIRDPDGHALLLRPYC